MDSKFFPRTSKLGEDLQSNPYLLRKSFQIQTKAPQFVIAQANWSTPGPFLSPFDDIFAKDPRNVASHQSLITSVNTSYGTSSVLLLTRHTEIPAQIQTLKYAQNNSRVWQSIRKVLEEGMDMKYKKAIQEEFLVHIEQVYSCSMQTKSFSSNWGNQLAGR